MVQSPRSYPKKPRFSNIGVEPVGLCQARFPRYCGDSLVEQGEFESSVPRARDYTFRDCPVDCCGTSVHFTGVCEPRQIPNLPSVVLPGLLTLHGPRRGASHSVIRTHFLEDCPVKAGVAPPPLLSNAPMIAAALSRPVPWPLVDTTVCGTSFPISETTSGLS
jgi:hypothetical protein